MDTSSHKDDNSIAADAGTLNSHENAADHADKDGDEPSGDGKEGGETLHMTILGGDLSSSSHTSVSLQRCVLRDCCDNKVHCPFCDTRQYKPAQPARVRDHLHLTHFQHAVYYDGLMVVKCFHACRGHDTRGGHYHCPVCSTTLLKRNAFTKHLLAHASRQGLENSAVQAPDAKKPSVIYYDGYKIELCGNQCRKSVEPHFHCPLCQRSCEQLSALTAHLWRCKKQAVSMGTKVDTAGYSLNVNKLFSPDMVQALLHLKDVKELKWHLSIVRNLSDLPLQRCQLSDCCKGRYHCPLCTTAKLKPNHLCHMRQHLVSHWRSGVQFREYTVLVCYLPCEVKSQSDKVRFHYHCPLCGATRRRREGFSHHLTICDPSGVRGQRGEDEDKAEEEEDGSGALEHLLLPGDTLVPLSEPDTWPSHESSFNMAQSTVVRRVSTDQAELQAAESLADMDQRILMEHLCKDSGDQKAEKTSCQSPEQQFTSGVLANQSLSSVSTVGQSLAPVKPNLPDSLSLSGNLCDVKISLVERTKSKDQPEDLADTNQQTVDGQSDSFSHPTMQFEDSASSQTHGNISLGDSCQSDHMQMDDQSQDSIRNISHQSAPCSVIGTSENKGSTEGCASAVSETGDSCTLEREGEKGSSAHSFGDNVQIFQQVTTQISDSIVLELQRRGVLEESLQAIGQVCSVAWQQTGAMVTMTCDLEQLCLAQNCFKQILKEGLQSFLHTSQSASSLGTKNSATASTTTTPQSPPAPPPPLAPPPKSSRKRGRPRGSKNKGTLLKKESPNPVIKRTRIDRSETCLSTDRTVAQDQGQGHSGEESSPGGSDGMDEKHHPSQNTMTFDPSPGRYSGRTRGKRINFAQLNAGGVSPPRSDSVEGPPPPVVTSPASTPKRGRGRPRKIQPGNTPAEDKQKKSTEQPAVAAEEEKSGGGSTMKETDVALDSTQPSQREDCDEGNGIRTVSQDGMISAPPFRSGSRDVFATEDGTVSTVSDIVQKAVEENVRSSIVRSEGEGNSAVATPNPSTQSLPASITSNISKAPDPASKRITTKHQNPKPPGGEGEVERWKEGHGGEEPRADSPTIAGRRSEKWRRRQGIADYAIIPMILFDCAVEDDATQEKVDLTVDTAVNSSAATEDSSSSIQCEETTKEMQELKDESSVQAVYCPVCKSTFPSYTMLSGHISQQHPQASVTCDVCEKVFPTSGALALHLERRHGPRIEKQTLMSAAHRCSKCGKECVSSASLRWHRALVHKESCGTGRGHRPRLTCTVCNYTAVDRWDMRHHRDLHRDQPATCPVCLKTLSTEAALKVHIAAKHTSDTYTCELCHKTFAHLRYLRSHMQRHGGEKRHVCVICGWRFYQTNTLRAHMDTHKPRSQRKYAFRCPHCPAAYNSQANFNDHLNKHTGDRPHICGKCGRGFAFRSMLTSHMAFVHSTERPHCCTECNKKYKTKAQLRQHQMTHSMARTGTSPFMCAKCGRPAASKSRLQAHSKRCKGGKYTQVLWRQRVVAPGQQNKLQAVDIVYDQPVHLQAPLVDLLPGQHLNIVHQGVAKDAGITLVPVHSSPTQGTPLLLSGESKPLLVSQVGVAPVHGIRQGDLQTSGTLDSGVSEDLGISASAEGAGEGLIVTKEFGSGPPTDMSGAADMSGLQNLLTPNTESGGLLLKGDNSHLSLPAENPSPSCVQSQTGVQSVEFHDSRQSQTLLQTAAPLHQLVLSDGFGQTQTLFLPPDLLKQEVVVIESEEGHHNVINLSSMQIVPAQNTISDNVENVDRQSYQVEDASAAQHSSDTEVLALRNSEGIDSAAGIEGVLDTSPAKGEEVNERSVYVCSMCSRQFDSMQLAQQHIILDHDLDPPDSASLNSDVAVSLETSGQSLSGEVDVR